MSRLNLAIIALAATTIFGLGAAPAIAQPTPLAPRTHSRATMMGLHAQEMQRTVASDIAAAKAKGADVSAAEKDKSEGDTALAAGHYRLAVEHYEAAQKALPAK